MGLVTYIYILLEIISKSFLLCGSGVWMQLKKENLLEKRLNLQQQSWENCQGVYLVSYLTINLKFP